MARLQRAPRVNFSITHKQSSLFRGPQATQRTAGCRGGDAAARPGQSPTEEIQAESSFFPRLWLKASCFPMPLLLLPSTEPAITLRCLCHLLSPPTPRQCGQSSAPVVTFQAQIQDQHVSEMVLAEDAVREEGKPPVAGSGFFFFFLAK